MAIEKKTTSSVDAWRWPIIVGLVVVAFFGAYKFASARSAQVVQANDTAVVANTSGAQGAAAAQGASAGGSCCGGGSGAAAAGSCCGGGTPTANGVTGTPSEGTAKLEGGVQRISVDVTTVYTPNTLKLKAGVPAEIAFSAAQGCTSEVQSAQLGFAEDLSTGPKTVKLGALKPGTYDFTCGMNMVHGKIVVE